MVCSSCLLLLPPFSLPPSFPPTSSFFPSPSTLSFPPSPSHPSSFPLLSLSPSPPLPQVVVTLLLCLRDWIMVLPLQQMVRDSHFHQRVLKEVFEVRPPPPSDSDHQLDTSLTLPPTLLHPSLFPPSPLPPLSLLPPSLPPPSLPMCITCTTCIHTYYTCSCELLCTYTLCIPSNVMYMYMYILYLHTSFTLHILYIIIVLTCPPLRHVYTCT